MSIFAGGVSVALATVAIWLSLHHKKRADEVNEKVQDLLLQVRSDAELLRSYAFNQLSKVTDHMIERVFDTKGPAAPAPAAQQGGQAGATDHATGDAKLTLATFRRLVQSISHGDRFSVAERDSAMSLIQEISGTQMQGTPEFASLLESLLDDFASAEQDLYIDAIDDWLPAITQGNSGINYTLLQHLGYRILGSTSPPKEQDVARFKRHRDHAADNGNEGIALAMWIVYNFTFGAPSDVDQTFREVDAIGQIKRMSFIYLVDNFCEESNIARRDTPSVRNLASRFRRFRDAHHEELNRLRDSSS